MTPEAAHTARRVTRATIIAFVATVVVSLGAWISTSLAGFGDAADLAPLFAPFPFLAGAVTGMVGIVILNPHLEHALQGRDARRVGRAVLRGDGAELDAEDRAAAARYAPVAAVSQRLLAVFFGLLFVGILIILARQIAVGSDLWPLPTVGGILVAAGTVITVPSMARQARNARAYAAAHPARPASAQPPHATLVADEENTDERRRP